MKRKILPVAIHILLVAVIFTSCTTRAEDNNYPNQPNESTVTEVQIQSDSYDIELVVALQQGNTETSEHATASDVQYQLAAIRENRAMQSEVNDPIVGRWYIWYFNGNPVLDSRTVLIFNSDGSAPAYQKTWGQDTTENRAGERTWRLEGNNVYLPHASSPWEFTFVGDELWQYVDGNVIRVLRRQSIPTPSWHTSQLNQPLNQLATGRWYAWYFGDFPVWQNNLEGIILNANGTKDTINRNWAFDTSDRISRNEGTWAIINNVQIRTQHNSGGLRYARLLGDELHYTNWQGSTSIMRRQRPDPNIREEDREHAAYFQRRQNQVDSITQRLLGEWHWDIFIWNFFEDGTGYIEIPPFGIHPADTMDFTFEIATVFDASAPTDIALYFTGDVSGRFLATFNTHGNGSITLHGQNEILLTRWFDIRNSPVTEQIFDQFLGFMEIIQKFTP